MGVAFMVMVPVLYTDTTDAWRLRDRRARVAIDAAGVAVEFAFLATILVALTAVGIDLINISAFWRREWRFIF